MARNHYATFIEEAFIDPIRSVLIVDDDFPTYDEVLTTAGQAGSPSARRRDKAWRKHPDRIAKLIATFRRRTRPLLVDIHDGGNVSTKEEITTATHLHQCDLLVLDYELDRSNPRDGARAISILRALMSNNHFNLVVIYTNEDLDFVHDAVRWGLISPSPDLLKEADVEEAEALIDSGEDAFENFSEQVRESIGSAQYFHSRQNQKSFLRTMAKAQQPYTLYREHANRVDWSSDQRKLVLHYLLKQVELTNRVSDKSQVHYDNLEWSDRGRRWIKSDSAFVALSEKSDNTDDLISDLQEALFSWSPRPSRLFLTKLRADIDEYGVAAQGHALRNHHALAYWYYRLLVDSSEDDRRWRIAETVSRHSLELLTEIKPRIEDFASRLIQAELASGGPLEICKEHFDVDLQNEQQKVAAVLEHNAFVCSTEPTGWHLTTGHVFSMSDDHWICLSPACDLVPSQIPPWQEKAFGKRLPFVGIRLYKVKATRVPEDIHSNRYLYIRLGDTVAGYCFNDPSSAQSAPRWQLLFAENQGRFVGRGFEFKVSSIGQGKTRLVSELSQARVIGQLRYEYALNLMQKLGISLTRVGLDFSAGAAEGA